MDEVRREQARAALEAASRLYEGEGRHVGADSVTYMADKLLRWLEEKS